MRKMIPMILKMAVVLVMLAGLFCSDPARASEMDFSKAVVIGSGPKTVVEFTDPDCPYCRTASKYFDGRPDVTRKVFFYPLPRHPKAKEKVQYALSQQDKAKAYHEIMSGKLDRAQRIEGITANGVKLQEEHLEITRKAKISATPTFIINGRIIEGLDKKRIEEALGR
ncbi:MAG: protein-disulfide isomerase [Desulfuromonadaceae bacterium GWB2_53_15]|nr:MAG: protein-disulfide isomerase [Desulfuromonadales bacterium GWD2_54_10]OHB25120.1 MAG: protein-disulfide isomerase [Desulfuromonadaceae bacterium GWB2_53_15]